jgi:hypothetical protein
MTQPIEKRSETRAITDVALEIYDTSARKLFGIARLLNLSTWGACVESTMPLGENPDLFVRMLLGKRTFAAPVKVVWERTSSSTREYGLRFGPYSDEMQEIVKSFIKENIQFYVETDLSLSPPPGAVRRS